MDGYHVEGIPAQSAYRWLALPPEELLRACRQARFQGSGPGGQKRNRVYSGIRLTHPDSGITAESVDGRSAQRNLLDALARLRLNLALSASLEGCDPSGIDAAPSQEASPRPEFRTGANPAHPDFPGFALRALHHLDWNRGRTAPAADALGCSASALTRFLKADKAVWTKAREIRERNGLFPLK
jgi:hypothetical protein